MSNSNTLHAYGSTKVDLADAKRGITARDFVDLSAEYLSQARSDGYPGHLCCMLYDKYFLQGRKEHICLDPDAQESFFDLSERNFSRRMHSWSCGRNVSYQFCLDDCSGRYQTGLVMDGPYGTYAKYGYYTGAGTVSNINVHFDDKVASVILRPYNPLKSGAVTLFQSENCLH